MKYTVKQFRTAVVAGVLACAALPAHADGGCMDIRSRVVFGDGIAGPSCSIEGESFDICLEGRVRGTLRGTWHAFTNFDWFVDLAAPQFPVPEETLSNYTREFNVFSTRRGSLIGDSQYVFDVRIFDVGGGFVVPVMIERGTGEFEGATGWIAAVFTDAGLSRGVLRGEVCGPGIRSDNDDSDSDD